MSILTVGARLPPLSGIRDDDSTLELQQLRGEHLVVYFYPKDNTPGCTTEAQQFRDLYPQFRKAGCEILGVSRDSAASHRRFRDKQQLPFPLIADVDETWCNAFGVLGQKMLYGRQYIGVIRSTFLLSPDSTALAVWSPVKVAGHAETVLARVREA